MPEVLQKANADPALMLLQNASCDKLCRQALIKAGGIELMLQLLAAHPLPLKQQHAWQAGQQPAQDWQTSACPARRLQMS